MLAVSVSGQPPSLYSLIHFFHHFDFLNFPLSLTLVAMDSFHKKNSSGYELLLLTDKHPLHRAGNMS